MKWRWTFVFALVAPFTCIAGQGADPGKACNEAYGSLPHGTILDLLDPKAPADRRASALAAYQRLATMTECPEFGYTLGQLYRHGPDLAGNPLPQDVAKAIELIRPMAEDGYLDAFADLAEMQMRHANAREAMRWTQIYLYFVQNVRMDFIEDPNSVHYQHSAYNGNLLARTELIWKHYARPPLPRRLVREDLNAWLAEHGARVTRRMRERKESMYGQVSAQGGGPARVSNSPGDCYLKLPNGIGGASAAWIVEVLPSGETGRIVLENFVPNPAVTELMKTCLLRYQFARFEGTESTTIRVPMVMGSPEGASMRRRR